LDLNVLLLLYSNLGKVIETTPTLGSNMEEVTHKNVKLKVKIILDLSYIELI